MKNKCLLWSNTVGITAYKSAELVGVAGNASAAGFVQMRCWHAMISCLMREFQEVLKE